MPAIFDLLLTLDQQSVVQSIQYPQRGPVLPALREAGAWVGRPLEDIPEINWNPSAGTAVWGTLRFDLEEFSPLPGVRCLLLRRENRRERLMEAALNLVPDCVQVYDADTSIQFFNRTCKQLLDIPQDKNLEGQRLLDIFAVDPGYSTTLTVLRTRSPVYGRFDVYKSTTGKDLSTVTTSLPIVQGDELLGAVSFERDMAATQRGLREYQTIQETLTRHLTDSFYTPRNTRYTLDDLVGSDPDLLLARDVAAKMASKEVNILIQGETGTGKEIFAQGIHALSSRRSEKFVAINCAAFPESLIEGMLFGTVKGAFTGSTDRTGLIEEANHGTLFLDELNSMSLAMQAKLLRVLQEKKLQRVGSTKTVSIDIRVISSCNEDAFALSENGKLRRDLFYRLASVVIEIPPLRERMGDLEELTWHYIRQKEDQAVTEITPAFWAWLRRHSWPGNVRELFHILDYAVNDCGNGRLEENNLPVYFRNRNMETFSVPQPTYDAQTPEKPDLKRGLSALVQEYEKALLQEAFYTCDQNISRAAELLRISRQNFQYYRKKYGLDLLS